MFLKFYLPHIYTISSHQTPFNLSANISSQFEGTCCHLDFSTLIVTDDSTLIIMRWNIIERERLWRSFNNNYKFTTLKNHLYEFCFCVFQRPVMWTWHSNIASLGFSYLIFKIWRWGWGFPCTSSYWNQIIL